MQLPETLLKSLNDQIALELSSAYAYFGMAAWFEHQALTGFATWMKLQGKEELGHAKKFYEYVIDRGGRVQLQALGQPVQEFASPLAVFEASLAHEQKVSAAICAIHEAAGNAKDYATQSFLKWFLDEQVEEEKTVNEMIGRLRLIGDSRPGLFQLDREAARRAEAEK
ncbi:MAG: ferritin [Bryobacteraceae bacterium]|nr:ferritin [Bryobacteraceae bacterium]